MLYEEGVSHQAGSIASIVYRMSITYGHILGEYWVLYKMDSYLYSIFCFRITGLGRIQLHGKNI